MSKGLLKYYETHDSHQKGVPLTEEWKKNISIASMGKPGTNTGKQFSPEWRLKISKSQLGKTRENTKERRFTTEIELEICKLYVEKKKSTYWLGNKYNCNRSLILTILDRNNVERRQSNYTGHDNGRRIFSDEQEKEICDTYKTGTVTLSDMSEKFDCKVSTIKSILLRYDVKL
jgi:transposase-like protein